jgi:predicted nucleic-acid-binding protein
MTEITRQNSFNAFDTIMDLMNQANFKTLVETHFNNYTEIKTIIIFIKSYQYLETLYFKTHGEMPDKEYISMGIKHIMADAKLRRFLIDSSDAFMKDIDTFENIISSNISSKLLLNK